MYSIESTNNDIDTLINTPACELTSQELAQVVVFNSGLAGSGEEVKEKETGLMIPQSVKNLNKKAMNILNILIEKNIPETLNETKPFRGLNKHTLLVFVAMKELIRRTQFSDKQRIIYPSDITKLLQEYAYKKKEYFICVYLNGAQEVIEKEVISIGILNKTIVHPREIFNPAIKISAASIILAHNHPSGSVLPSTEDETVTKRIIKAGDIIGIPILDHIIMGKDMYYSFGEHNKLTN